MVKLAEVGFDFLLVIRLGKAPSYKLEIFIFILQLLNFLQLLRDFLDRLRDRLLIFNCDLGSICTV